MSLIKDGRIKNTFTGYLGNKPGHQGICVTPDGTLFFGEYTLNMKRENDTHLYRSIDGGRSFQIILTLRKSEVRHIHFIKYDPYEKCVWLGTGDEDRENRLMRSFDNGDTWETVGEGSQDWRAIGICFDEYCLTWGTDAGSVPNQNHIIRMDRETNMISIIADAEAHVMGCGSFKDGRVFISTGVEGGENEKDRYARLKTIENGKIKEMLKYKKDLFPFILQYGVIRFPLGTENTDRVVYTTYGLIGNGECVYVEENKNRYSNVKVLLIEGRARQVMPLMESLHKLGCHVTTYNASKLDMGYSSHYPDKKILSYCDAKDPKGSWKAISKELKTKQYDLVIPLNDFVAIMLSQHKEELKPYVDIAVNDWDVFQYASDKLKTMEVCMDNEIPCPKTYLSESLEDLKNMNLQFPVCIKPRTGYSAVGFRKIDNPNELEKIVKASIDKYGPSLIQEYIPQTDLQYKAEIFIDKHGEMKSCCIFSKIRWYPIDGGSSTLNMTVHRPDIQESCAKTIKSNRMERICRYRFDSGSS